MQIKSTEIVREIRTGADNPRNSEGSFARLGDGRILFVYSRFHGKSWDDDAPSDIFALTLSEDGREVLSETPERLVSASEYENVSNIMSPSLLRLGNGDLGLFYLIKSGRSKGASGGCEPCITDYVMRRSSDEHSFAKETEVLCSTPILKTYSVVNNDRVLRTSSGRLLVPLAKHRLSYMPKSYYFDGVGTVKLLASDDDGRSWREIYGELALPSTAHSWAGLQEPGLIELPSGAIYLYARTDRMLQYESISPDEGVTWTPVQPSRFTSPMSPMKIARNPYSGLYYSVWNPIPDYNGRVNAPTTGGRTPLVIAESSDGMNFSPYAVLEGDPMRGFCYPAIFCLDEKTLLVSYCSGYPEEGNCICSTTIRRITLE